MPFDDFLGNGQSHARTGELRASMETLEEQKDSLGMLEVDPNAVIAHRESPFALYLLRGDVHARRLGAVKFEGVSHQVL